MLEHTGSGVEDLYKDLTVGQVSAWQQFSLAYTTTDNGAHYYTIIGNVPVIGSRTVQLRQYFRYVRQGAVRVGATSNHAGVRPVAFHHTARGEVVVLHVSQSGRIGVRGLAAGSYGVSMATASNAMINLPDVTIGADGSGIISPASAGVVTIYRR